MRKKPIADELPDKARRREIKKRPRMKMHGASLRKNPKRPAGAIMKFG